ncbi:N-acetyltransferase [Deinococcus sp. Leaf326]|uniref:GNAT family N-acetyltransferase n=1 Tax=Deinococcus sp. Leaf326 TaxID=1736338 RepID=UPI0006F59D9F|nr:GNAT family N-acetyltransferase [Deinococcus sp. Leaf326]KQR04685.1 GCN5 family acetyltransferase [Deinococcus sp. Leaf326]
MTPFTLRAFNVPDDLPATARVLNAADPGWPVTAEQLRHEHETRDPALYFTQVIAEQGGEVVGVGGLGHDNFSFEDWRYWGRLAVAPEARGQGVGAAIYAELLRRVQARGARELRTMLSDLPHDRPGVAFLTARGFSPVWDRYESSVHTADLDLEAFSPLLSAVAAQGIELRSLAELRSDPERDRQLHELDWLLFQDVPMGTALTRRPLEQWVQDELGDPTLRPELSFVAVDPARHDPLTGPYVGYSTIGWNPAGDYGYIGMTGVLREYRGRGLAKALKVAAMRALHAVGGGQIKTFNDAPNQAMIAMNEALGFRRTATRTRYELRLDPAQAVDSGV